MRRLVLFGLLAFLWSVPAGFACMIGVATVPCNVILRTVIVAPIPVIADYRTPQAAEDAALPGDRILVRTGTYTQTVTMWRPATMMAPIWMANYPGESPKFQPVVNPGYGVVNVNASWHVLEGIEISGGWHGVQMNASNSIVYNNYVHDAQNQGILGVSLKNAAIVFNRVERNGLTNPTPWLNHGIYLSDYYGLVISRIAIIGNTVKNHGGSAIQAYPGSAWRETDIQIEGNYLIDNAVEIILVFVERATVKGNAVTHNGYPATNAPRTALLWIENSRQVLVDGNSFTWGILAPSIPAYLVWEQNQNPAETTFQNDKWIMPAGWPTVTDADLGGL